MQGKAKVIFIIIICTAILSCKRTSEPDRKKPIQNIENNTPVATANNVINPIENDVPQATGELHSKGLRLYNQKKYKEAIDVWLEEIKLNPHGASAYNDIGIAYVYLQDSEAAIKYHKKAIEVDPNYGHGHYSLALAYYRTGKYEEAKEEFKKAITLNYRPTEASKMLENNIEPEILRETPTIKEYFFSGDSLFKDIDFPQKAIVAEKTPLYDNKLTESGELPKGDIITITGLYDKFRKNDASGMSNDFFYIVDNGESLVRTNHVIPKSKYDTPAFVSPKGAIQIIKTPVSTPIETNDGDWTVGWEYLWLKLKDGNVLFLDDYVLYDENPISWSDDEQYFFASGRGKVLSPDGKLIWEGSKSDHPSGGTVNFTSVVWKDGIFYFRGIGVDDSVYSFNPKTGEFKMFLSLTEDGKTPESGGDGIQTWPRIEFKNEFIKARFTREDTNPPDKEKPCVTIEVTADKNGKIIKKDKKSWGFCD